MLSPVCWGSEASFARLLESRNAIVDDAASVQLQYEPAWRVDGSPFCEQAAQAPSLWSQSVRAIHGWSQRCQLHSCSINASWARAHRFPLCPDNLRLGSLDQYIRPYTSDNCHSRNHECRNMHCPLDSYLLPRSKSGGRKRRCRMG